MKKKSFLAMLLSGVLALLTAGVTYGFTKLAMHGALGHFFNHVGYYITYNLIVAICIFFIVKQNYRSLWYVFSIANLLSILMVFVLKSFSDYHQFLIVFAGWGLSLIVTLIAALIGKRIESKKLNEPYQLSRDLKSTNIAMFLSGVLAYFTTFVASVFLINARHDYFGQFFSQDGGFITYDLIISICIFFIVKKNYRSFWYVPVIANLGGILAVFVIHYFDHPLEFTYIFAGWGLSVIVTIIAAIIGYRIESRKLKEIPKSS